MSEGDLVLAKRTFVTGQPGSGKTTLVMALVHALLERGVRCQGFYTQECREGGKRIGFDIVTIPSGERAPLARKNGPRNWPKVGSYSVDVASLEKYAVPTLVLPQPTPNSRAVEVVICDEVGRMELKSEKFKKAVRTLLKTDIPVLGTLTAARYGHRVAFCDWIREQDEVAVYNVTKSNRDETRASLLPLVCNAYSSLSAANAADGDGKKVSPSVGASVSPAPGMKRSHRKPSTLRGGRNDRSSRRRVQSSIKMKSNATRLSEVKVPSSGRRRSGPDDGWK